MLDKEFLSNSAQNISEAIKGVEEITNAIITTDKLPNVETGQSSTLLDSALNSDFNSPQELSAKKVMAAAMVIAKRKGVLPAEFPENSDAISVASIADEAVTRMKVAVQTAAGNIDVYAASDKLIDQATARVLAVSDTIVERGIDAAVNKIGLAVARTFPPAIPVILMIKNYQPMITEKAQKYVRTGIQKLNTYAKTAVRKVGDFVKNKLTSTFKSLLFS